MSDRHTKVKMLIVIYQGKRGFYFALIDVRNRPDEMTDHVKEPVSSQVLLGWGRVTVASVGDDHPLKWSAARDGQIGAHTVIIL
jgi:hypothetical protein